MAGPRWAVHRTILVVDVEQFGSPRRTDRDRVAVRSGLYHALTVALDAAGIDWSECDHEDRGDGVLVVIPPTAPKTVLVESLPDTLVAELRTHNQAYPAPQHIRLRMALHAGEVRYDDHGVVGTSVNHAFRLLESTAFKTAFAQSQALLGAIVSSWFFDEVVRHTDAGTAATYHPANITAKETTTTAWIHLSDDGLPHPADSSTPQQLPTAGRYFVGRDKELAHLSRLLTGFLESADQAATAIAIIVGTAGVGKTTLATRWANDIRHRFPDGHLHVNLRGFDPRTQLDPAQALHGFLEAIGVAAPAIPNDMDARSALYRSLVANRRMLILLDNARSTDQVRPLLPNSTSCLVVVTSRNRLDSLVVREGAHRIDLDVLPPADAERLFAGRVGPDRLIAEPHVVTELVDRCVRLPLALSIVAARAANQPNLPLRQLADHLRDERDRLDTLDLGDSDLDMRAVFSWSYRVLSPPAARLFRLLGVHPGPDIDILACTALLGDGRAGPPLTELTAAHLLEEHLPGRYRFHDLLRVYAEECAEHDEPDLHTARTRLITFYVDATAAADCHIQRWRGGEARRAPPPTSPPYLSGYQDAMSWLAREKQTLLAIVDWAAANGLADGAGRLAWALTPFLQRSGQRHERAAVWQAARDAAPDEHARVRALSELARALARLGQFEEPETLLDEAAVIAAHLGDDHLAFGVNLGYVRVFELQERHADALRHAERAWALARYQPNLHHRADALTALARQQTGLGRPTEAVGLGARALALYREISHPEGEAYAQTTLGDTYRRLGEHERAIDCFQRSLAIDREIGARYWEGHCLDQIGDLHDLLDRQNKASQSWRDAAVIFDELHHPDGTAVRAKLNDANPSVCRP